MSARGFTIPVGDLELAVPPGRHEVPGLLWGNLAAAALLVDQGYDLVARDTLEKLQGWLDRTRLEDLAFPGEVEKRKGRKLAAGIQPGDELLSWYVVDAEPRREGRVEESLIEAGFPVYAPRMAYWLRTRKGKTRIERPLLARYLFAGARSRLDDRNAHDDDVNAILSLEHVMGIVRFNPAAPPKPAPFGEVRAILEQELRGEFDKTISSKKRYQPKPDERVRVTVGSFQGFPAKFCEWTEDDRVRVLQHMFGRWIPMTYDADEIEPAT